MSTETTTTTIPPCGQEPPPEGTFCGPIDDPVTDAQPATRGTQVDQSPPDGQCWVPTDRMDEFPLTNYVDCALLEQPVSIPEATVAVGEPPVPVTELPATGMGMDLAIVAGVFIMAGAIMLAIRKWGPKDRSER